MNNEVEYLKEHLYEIYKYKKSMKDLTYDMDLEHLLRTCKALDYLQQELERYKNIIDELIEYGDNCLENLKDQDNYMCESIDVVGLMQMIHIMYLEKLKELKGE